MKDEKENIVKTVVIVAMAILVLMSMLPAMVSAQSDVKINEIMYNPPGTDAYLKWIELYNNDTTAINIGGWKFYEADTNHSLTVVQGSRVIPVGGYVIIANNATAFLNEHPECNCTVIDSTFSLRNSDEYIALKNATSDIVDEVTYNASWGADGNGKTLERTATGGWAESLADGGTPCTENGMTIVRRGTPIIVEEKQIGIAVITRPTTGDIKINEIMYDPSTEQGNVNKMEWIELYNNDTEAVNISGWTLNGREILGRIMQPEDYVVLAWNKTAVEAYYGDALTCPVIDITLQLVNNPGDTIVLKNRTDVEVDNVTYNSSWGADGNGKTLERTATGTWAESIVDGGTPCKLNSVAIVIPFIKINEIMYDPSTEQGNDNKMEWIELYNNDTEAVNISGWTLNGREILDTIMQPEDYVVLAWNKTAVEAYYGDALTCPVIDITLQLVNNPGDTIVLCNSTGAEIDNVTYNASWGAAGDGKTLERTATGGWAESLVDGGTPCKLNSVAIVIPFSSWGPPVIYISNITVDATDPENVGKNATTKLFTATEMIDNVSYYVVNICWPTATTKMYISMDVMNEDYLVKRVAIEAAVGPEPMNLTFDPAFVMWDFPLEAGKTWTSTSNVTGNLPVSEAPVSSTAVVPSKITAEEVTVPLGTFPCLVVENNISYEVAGIPISNLEKHWISPTDNGFLCPKYQRHINGALVEEQELIEVIPPTFLNASDNNTAINVTTGEFLVVTLEGNPTTGYTWEVEELNEQVLQQVGDIVSVPESDLMGAPSKQIATFEVVGAGDATIKMVYHQPWDTDVEPVDTFTLNVTAS